MMTISAGSSRRGNNWSAWSKPSRASARAMTSRSTWPWRGHRRINFFITVLSFMEEQVVFRMNLSRNLSLVKTLERQRLV